MLVPCDCSMLFTYLHIPLPGACFMVVVATWEHHSITLLVLNHRIANCTHTVLCALHNATNVQIVHARHCANSDILRLRSAQTLA